MGNPQRPLAHPPHALSDEQQKLAHDLIGTCGLSNPDWYEDLIGEGDQQKLLELDNIVFMCAGCGWWCAAEECNEIDADWHCDECAKEIEEDAES